MTRNSTAGNLLNMLYLQYQRAKIKLLECCHKKPNLYLPANQIQADNFNPLPYYTTCLDDLADLIEPAILSTFQPFYTRINFRSSLMKIT